MHRIRRTIIIFTLNMDIQEPCYRRTWLRSAIFTTVLSTYLATQCHLHNRAIDVLGHAVPSSQPCYRRTWLRSAIFTTVLLTYLATQCHLHNRAIDVLGYAVPSSQPCSLNCNVTVILILAAAETAISASKYRPSYTQ